MIQIVPYTTQYKDEVIHLVLDVYENELQFLGFERPDIYDIPGTYQKDTKSNFWVALHNNTLIGTVGVLGKKDGGAYLKRMIVKKEYRRQGLGVKLLEAAIHFAKKQKYCKLYAGTVPENPNAIQFYKRNGFIQTKNVPQDITASKDSICLELDLQK